MPAVPWVVLSCIGLPLCVHSYSSTPAETGAWQGAEGGTGSHTWVLLSTAHLRSSLLSGEPYRPHSWAPTLQEDAGR